jgi:hypothetical protein
MQLTRFDRWLIEEFVHETHIHTMSPPPSLPRGVREIPVPETQGRRFRYHYVTYNPRKARVLADLLKDHGQLFSTHVMNRRKWYVPLIAPEGKSVTWRLVWILFICVSGLIGTTYLHRLWSDGTFQENFFDAIKTLQG